MTRARTLTLAALFGALAALPGAAIDFSNYHTPAQIASELQGLAVAHPSIARVVTIGTSVEGRPIHALKISDNVATDEHDEGDVVFVGLHHAREWLTPEMALYLAEYLVTHHDSDAALRACMDQLEIWVIPVLNPDGYAYTASAPANRYWRKNRRNNGDGTFGVDLNRNYAYQWGLGGGGSEGSPISSEDTYWGPGPFSEPETAAFRTFVEGLDNPRALMTYHTYSELFLRPWSYSSADPPGEPTLAFLAQNSIARIAAVHGHTYAETIWYHSFGETTDYFWNGLRLAGFTTEMRPTLGGVGGFAPPASEIVPNNEENLPSALALIADAGCCRAWIKDYAGDTGQEPSAVWTSAGWSHAFWESPDIWTVPAEPTEGATVSLFVRVHNDTSGALNGATVRAYYTDPRVSLEFPSLTSNLIGEQTVNLAPGDTTVTFSWHVPSGTNSWGEHHWCVGAIVTHPDDRPLTNQIQRSSNIGGRNFQTLPALSTAQTLFVAVHNFLEVEAEYQVTVDPASLPAGWKVQTPFVATRTLPSRKARLLGVKGNVLAPGQTVFQPLRVEVPPGVAPETTVDVRVSGALLPIVPGRRDVLGNGYTFRLRTPKVPCNPD